MFKLDKKLRAVISAAVAVCGVSAAIAATGAVLAKVELLAQTGGVRSLDLVEVNPILDEHNATGIVVREIDQLDRAKCIWRTGRPAWLPVRFPPIVP